MPKTKIVPAILSPNRDDLQDFLNEIEDHVDLLQIDVMDNVFVPNETPQAEQLTWFTTKLPLDIHLMVKEPSENYLMRFIQANPNLRIHNITVHYEACSDLNKTISFIASKGIKPSIAINPKTTVENIKPFLDTVEMVLVMTVEPGFSGQSFIESALEKVTRLRKLKPELDIEVDGGITDATAKKAAAAGANLFVANSYIYKAPNRLEAIRRLRAATKTSNLF